MGRQPSGVGVVLPWRGSRAGRHQPQTVGHWSSKPPGRLIAGTRRWSAVLLTALSACAEREAPPVAVDPDRQCWSTERLLVSLGEQTYGTPPIARSRGFVLATAVRRGDLLDLPTSYREQRQLALRMCQRRDRVPVLVSELSFQMRAGALFADSPAYNRIALLAVVPTASDAPFGSVRSDASLDAVLPTERLGPRGEQPYRFGGGLIVRCAPVYREHELPPQRWSSCSALLAVDDATRLWVQFDGGGRSPDSFPRAVAAAQALIQSTRR